MLAETLPLACHYPPYEELKNASMSILQFFHNFTMLILIVIMTFITIIMMKKNLCSFTYTKFLSSRSLELIWTFVPMIILLCMAIPSLIFLYMMDMSSTTVMTLKVFGAQWYWMYQYGEFQNFTISSYMLSDMDLLNHENKFICGWRLLETDVRAILPYSAEVRLLVTSQDVIHSFSLPGLGIKMDAIPGRLNWTSLFNSVPGSVYGQCSEICGVGHSFMPIIIEFTSLHDCIKFIFSKA